MGIYFNPDNDSFTKDKNSELYLDKTGLAGKGDATMDMKRIKQNKLKTILQFSILSIIAMLLQTIITITDGYFLSQSAGIRFKRFVFDRQINREMFFNGSSEFIGEMASAISMFVFRNNSIITEKGE